MKNRITAFLLAAAMMAPAASLWASAGDASLQGANGNSTGAPASKTIKIKTHHGHHHKKGSKSGSSGTSNTSNTSTTPGSK